MVAEVPPGYVMVSSRSCHRLSSHFGSRMRYAFPEADTPKATAHVRVCVASVYPLATRRSHTPAELSTSTTNPMNRPIAVPCVQHGLAFFVVSARLVVVPEVAVPLWTIKVPSGHQF